MKLMGAICLLGGVPPFDGGHLFRLLKQEK
jgi:hypothetical protein